MNLKANSATCCFIGRVNEHMGRRKLTVAKIAASVRAGRLTRSLKVPLGDISRIARVSVAISKTSRVDRSFRKVGNNNKTLLFRGVITSGSGRIV